MQKAHFAGGPFETLSLIGLLVGAGRLINFLTGVSNSTDCLNPRLFNSGGFMTVRKYEENGKTFWQVYIDIRGRKDSRVRVQKRVNGLTSEREAIQEEKRLLRELTEKATTLEARGMRWSEVIERWVRQQDLYPTKKYAESTIKDYEAVLKNWTIPWLDRPASELNRADGRDIMREAEAAGRSASFRRGLKYTINMVYSWGIEERLINGPAQSPVFGIEVDREREEKRPEILTVEEIRNLLKLAREQKHE